MVEAVPVAAQEDGGEQVEDIAQIAEPNVYEEPTNEKQDIFTDANAMEFSVRDP